MVLGANNPFDTRFLDEQRLLDSFRRMASGPAPSEPPTPNLEPSMQRMNGINDMLNSRNSASERLNAYSSSPKFAPMPTSALNTQTVAPTPIQQVVVPQIQPAPSFTSSAPSANTSRIATAGVVQNPSTPGGNAVLQNAAKYKGTKYVWGGTSPKGFDCSGFTQYVARESGINIPRTASSQFSYFKKAGKLSATMEGAQPGDMLYFESSASPSGWHTGIYLGNGKMINAAGRKSGVVVQSIGSRKLRGVGHI